MSRAEMLRNIVRRYRSEHGICAASPGLPGPRRCCGEGCRWVGNPQPGDDFFVCDECLRKLDDACAAIHARSIAEKN
jgi:hypothetical protein